MDITSGARRSPARPFGIYAAVTFVPVVVLGIVLAITFRSDANRRGLAEGRSEAALIAQTARASATGTTMTTRSPPPTAR